MKYYLSISAVTIYLSEPIFCELNGQQVVTQLFTQLWASFQSGEADGGVD